MKIEKQFRTSHCREHGHPEFTLQFQKSRPLPLEKMLLGFFEQGVAKGKQFTPGQTIGLGWAVLRLVAREDGTLGVEEREGEGWVESCDRSLMETWLQKEVVSSLGLAGSASFATADQTAMVARCAFGNPPLLLVRSPVGGGRGRDSGFDLTCADDHDHGERRAMPLFDIGQELPFLVQFFALPPKGAVLVEANDAGRIVPTVYLDGQRAKPLPNSYLESLSQDD